MANTFESQQRLINGGSEIIISKVDFGPMPEDPSDLSENDTKALAAYYEHHPDKFPSDKFLDVKSWRDWRDISFKEDKESNKWTGKYHSLFEDKIVEETFDNSEDAQIWYYSQQDADKTRALDLIREARNFAIGEDLDSPWEDIVPSPDNSDIQHSTYTNPDVIAASPKKSQQSPEDEYTEPKTPDLDDLEAELSRLVADAATELSKEQGGAIVRISDEQSKSFEPNLDILYQQLSSNNINQSESGKLARIEDKEYSDDSFEINPNNKEIEILKEKALEAISDYQQFIEINRNNLRDEKIYNEYRIIEKKAWFHVGRFIHKLGGEIATLPQERDIQLAHPEVVDIKEYLVNGEKIILDEEDNITHLNIDGNIIELNKPRTIEELLKAKRPAHILYHSGNPIFEDDPTKQNYRGLLIDGLNENTLELIEGVLNKKETVIVDETKPVSEELAGQTPDKVVEELEPTVGVEPKIEQDGINTTLNPESTYQSEGEDPTSQVSLEGLRLAYARAEETWNRKRGDENLRDAFIEARDAYNTELEKVLKLQVAQGQEANIHELFKNEVISLREQRITESKELQSALEKKFNPLKEKFVNFVIKHKKLMGRVNLGLGIAGGALALTGVGIPLAGGLAVTRRAISGILLGVSSGEGVRSLGEDADINLAWGKIQFKAVIPKLVKESLDSSDNEMKAFSDDILKDRLGTLEAYYRLNGGKFTNNDQQKAYEKILIELGHRVRVNTIENYQNAQESSKAQTQDSSDNQDSLQESVDTYSQDNNSTEVVDINIEPFNFGESRYTSELLNTISDKRVQELDKFRRKRKIATVTGIGVGLLVGGAVHALDELNKPDSLDAPESGVIRPNIPDADESAIPQPSTGTEIAPGTTPQSPEAPPTGAGGEALSQSEQLAQSAEATRAAAEQAAQQAAEKLAQNVSSLDPGDTIWSKIADQLGEGATEAQIQQAVENLLQSEVGQDSIYKLAQGTEGGRALLAQWGIDNAGEMATLSKEQLYEVSRYLAPGELQGITELNLDNLTPFEVVEPPQVDVSEAMDNSTPATEAPTPSVEPTPSAAPEAPVSPEVTAPTETTAFTQELSEILGKSNLTEIQARDIVQSYFTDDYGREAIYQSLTQTPEGAQFLSQGFGVNNALDFANLTPEQMYEISQSINPADLEKIINESLLSKFEMVDVVSLAKGDTPLGAVNRYIASEVGNLPYDSTLGQQVLNTYIDTPAGKEWLYESIVSNPNPDNQNVQMFREYLRFKGIQSVEDFKQTFDWAEFSGNRRIPTSAFWNYTRLPNGNMRIAPLSTFLQPGKMVGIPDAIRQVLTKQ